MKTSSYLLLSALLCPWLAHALSVGDQAPNFTLTNSSGEVVRLTDFSGEKVVLEWTNHLCPFVRKHYLSGNMPDQQRQAREAGIVWLSIISSAPGKQGHVDGEQAESIAEDWQAAPQHILLDPSGQVGMKYKAKTTPHMFLIGGEGQILYQGAIDSIPTADKADLEEAEQYLLSAFKQLAQDQPIATASTRPYGCSIKY